jgi:hypothetical protein
MLLLFVGKNMNKLTPEILTLNDFHNIFIYTFTSNQILDLYKLYQQIGPEDFFSNISKVDQNLMTIYMHKSKKK